MVRPTIALERLEPREVPATRLNATVFISHLYSDVVGRRADDAGQQFWENRTLDSNHTSVAGQFLTAPEAHAASVRDLYARYLGRAARAEEVTFWLGSDQGTFTERALILGSPEYFQAHGGTAEGFLDGLYKDVLGRPVDQAGKDFFLPQLAGNVSRSEVARQVLRSGEAGAYLASLWYPQYLHRAATGDERAAFARRLAANGYDEDLTLAQVLGSAEYTAQAQQSAGDTVLEWATNLANAIRTDRTPPPRGSRIIALVTLAMYDAAQTAGHQAGVYNPTTPAAGDALSAEAAVAAAAHRVLVNVYPAQKASLDAALATTLARITDTFARDRGQALGVATADALLAARATDGSATANTPYTPGTTPPAWQPTPGPTASTSYRPALLPGWGNVKPYFLTAGSQFRPPAPPAPGTPEYQAAFQEVFDLGNDTSTKRTADQTQIAIFWADNPDGVTATPPGHWVEITVKVARENGFSLAESARVLALVGAAVADAGINAWDAKYVYNFWRPITAINDLLNDPQVPPDQYSTLAWRSFLPTPNFPTYTSGHSTFSNAAAEVLTRVFGDNYAFNAISDSLPSVQRPFGSFLAAAAEAGQSRIYGGIHFQFDNTAGSAAGKSIGDWVFEHFPHG